MKHLARTILVSCMALLAFGTVLAGCACSNEGASSGESSASAQAAIANDRGVSSSSAEPEEVLDEAELMKPFYVLLMGCDTRANTIEGKPAEWGSYKLERSDTIILMHVVPDTGRITLLTVPRDHAATIDGKLTRINEFMNKKGPEGAMEGIGGMAGIDIKYYVATDFAHFVSLIDALGGVDVNSPITMTWQDIIGGEDITITQGEHHLNGAETLVYARVRKLYAGIQEAARQVQDREIAQNVLAAMSGKSEEELSACAKAIHDNTDSNMSEKVMQFYLGKLAEKGGSLSFASGTFPYVGDENNEEKIWVVPYDENTWKEIIRTIEEGGDPNAIVSSPAVVAG